MARTDPQLKLRLPPDLKVRIEEEAKRNNRSINAQLVFMLEEFFLSEDGSEVTSSPDAKSSAKDTLRDALNRILETIRELDYENKILSQEVRKKKSDNKQ